MDMVQFHVGVPKLKGNKMTDEKDDLEFYKALSTVLGDELQRKNAQLEVAKKSAFKVHTYLSRNSLYKKALHDIMYELIVVNLEGGEKPCKVKK